jgi:hypothetical protein
VNAESRRIRRLLRDDLPHYAKKCLRIRTKTGAIVPFELNQAQQHVHERLEKQLRETGRVRALLLKARQLGMSTYVEARYYHKTSHQHGIRAYILTHEDAATKNIFEMAQRYHDHCPEVVKPHTGASSAKELFFDLLDSGYRVATAGTKGTGRSATIQLFHGSEVAYWPNAETHAAGAMQAVPAADGSEIILESTSNGPEGLFYKMCLEAHTGESDWQLIFIPWFWMDEYRLPVPEGFELTDEERQYGEEHGLDAEQLAWRRAKIRELDGVWNFRREYPATAEEAFSAERPGALWNRQLLADGRRKHSEVPPIQRYVVGVDPATSANTESNETGIIVVGKGVDKHAYVFRDLSGRYSPAGWARRAIAAYHDDDANGIVAEANQGGDMVKHTIHSVDDTVAVKLVHAAKAKQARAEPVATKYEEGRVHHVGELPGLEDQLVTWEPHTGVESPDRLDALVWAIEELLPSRKAKPAVAPAGDWMPNYWGGAG